MKTHNQKRKSSRRCLSWTTKQLECFVDYQKNKIKTTRQNNKIKPSIDGIIDNGRTDGDWLYLI